MESTYISYSKAKISPINSTFLRSKSWSFIDDCSIWQSHEWNSSFNNPFNNYIRRVPRLLPSSTWIDINGWIKLRVSRFDNPRGFAKTFRENWSVEMNTWKIGIGPEVKRGMEVGRYEVTWGCAAHKGSFAPVNPSGFIEPHRAWHGIPATLLYAMHQNTGGSQLSWTIPGILTFPSLSSLQNFPP